MLVHAQVGARALPASSVRPLRAEASPVWLGDRRRQDRRAVAVGVRVPTPREDQPRARPALAGRIGQRKAVLGGGSRRRKQLASVRRRHTRRVTRPFIEAWRDFQRGERLLGLSRLAQQAASALDNASDPLPRLSADGYNDLEVAYFTNEREDHQEVGHRLVCAAPAGRSEAEPSPVLRPLIRSCLA